MAAGPAAFGSGGRSPTSDGPDDDFLDAGGVLMAGGDPEAEFVGLDADGLVEGDGEGVRLVAGDIGGGNVDPFATAPELDLECLHDILRAESGEEVDAGEFAFPSQIEGEP